MRFVLFYLLFGTALAAGTIALPACRRHIRTVAGRLGMSLNYACLLWISGAVIAWPAGLYVLSTGRLLPPAGRHDDEDGISALSGDGGEVARPAETSGSAPAFQERWRRPKRDRRRQRA